MSWLNRDIEKENIALLGVLVLTAAAALIITNLRAVFWDYSLFPYVSPGRLSYYHINYYDFGFVKRGFVGSVLATLGLKPGMYLINYLALSIGLILCCAGGYLIYRMKEYFNSWYYLLFVGFILFNSATFMHLGYDLGRFDQLLVICSIFSFYCIRNGWWMKLIGITVVAILIHELYMIMFFPAILYALVCYSDINGRRTGYVVGAVGLMAALLFFFGRIEDQSVQQIAQTVSATKFTFGDYGRMWTSTLADNFYYTMNTVSGFHQFEVLSLVYGAGYMLLTVGVLILIAMHNKKDWLGYIVILITSTPIFFIAIDYSRWYALIIVNAFLFFGFTIFANSRKNKAAGIQLTRIHLLLCTLLLLSGIVLGPIGIIRSFPLMSIY